MEPVTPEIVSTDESIQQSLMSLQESMQILDSTAAMTQSARNQILVKLLPEVIKMDLEVTDRSDPELFESKARLIAETRGLLNDMDTSARNHTNMKLKQKDVETNAANTLNAAEFLAQIKLGGISVSQPKQMQHSEQEISEQLETRFAQEGLEILPTELETGQTQLPEPRVSDDF